MSPSLARGQRGPVLRSKHERVESPWLFLMKRRRRVDRFIASLRRYVRHSMTTIAQRAMRCVRHLQGRAPMFVLGSVSGMSNMTVTALPFMRLVKTGLHAFAHVR